MPQPNSVTNREIIKKANENFTKLRQHVSKECRKLLTGHTTLRGVWIALRTGCDRGTVLPLIAKVEAFYSNKWEPKDTISSYTSRLRDLYLSLETTDQQINRDLAVHFLIDRLPDCYKSEGQAAKQQNLPFVATTAYLLANVKDNSTTGDNTSGQALVIRGQKPSRITKATKYGRNQNRGFNRGGSRLNDRGSRFNDRNPNYRDITCNWCKLRGHRERECRTKQNQINSGEVRKGKYGSAYLVKSVNSQSYTQVPSYSSPSLSTTQYPQNTVAASPAGPVHAIPWHGPPQMNLAYAPSPVTPQSQIHYQNPNPPSDSAHLLLACATYVNRKDQTKDVYSWVLDSGASHHFANDVLDLKHYKRFQEPKEVYLGDNTIVYAEGQGTQLLQIGPYTLDLSVWFVSDLAENLLSSRLLDKAGYSLLIEEDIVQIRKRDAPNSEWHRLADALSGDLYRVHINRKSMIDSPRALRTREYSTLRMWHNRLGHRDFRAVGAMLNLSVPRILPVCAACQQGKMKASPHPRVLERASKPFELVHADHVPLDGISFGGSKYMLIIMDDFTRYVWVYFSSLKDATTVTPLIRAFIMLILTQFNIVIKRWRTDGGTGEFLNSLIAEVYQIYGMIHQPSTPHVKQQNGAIERRIQTLKNMERTMRAGAGVLDDYRFQAESLATAVLLTNIQPSSMLGDCSPHLLLFGKQPPFDFLKPWGCLAYVNLRKEQRSGADPHCRPAMLVGYVAGSTSVYKCLDVMTLKTSNHSEVRFDDELFPGPWIKRPANFKPSLAQRKNPPGSAVDTRIGHAVPRTLPPSIPHNSLSVPLSSMSPFWMQATPPAAYQIINQKLSSTTPQLQALKMSVSQPVYNVRGNIVFGTCDKIHKQDTTKELVEAEEEIVQGMESLSNPPWQNKDVRTDHNGDPLSYKDALSQDPIKWPPAIKEELQSLENGTWVIQEISQMPKGCKPIPGKWVFKRKELPDGGTRYKARLVIRGFLQRYGIDFMETFAPTASLAAFRLLVAISVFNGWSLRNLDIITAFLNGDVDAEIYMGVPEGMNLNPKKFVLKLRRSLYVLRQAPRIWWERMRKFLLQSGFNCCHAEPAIFVRNYNGRFVILLLFVDDILLTGTDEGIEDFVKECSREFKTRDLGNPKLFLGIHIERRKDKVIIHQRNYIKRLLERFNAPRNPVATPLDPKQPLVEAPETELLNEKDALEYRAAVGGLMYLMICTRPDLAYTLSRLSKFSSRPGTKHAVAIKRVFRYLVGTQDLGISFTVPDPSVKPQLYGYSDSDFAADLNNRRSTSGFVFLLNGGPISWKSKQQSLVTSSTHDAEYVGLANASYEITWLRKIILAILPDYTEHQMPANILYCDNQGAIATANQPDYAVSGRSKHIDVRFHIIRDATANGLVRLEYIRSSEMTADILTKALPKELHLRHVKGLGMDTASKVS